jgi:hypothetical protein
LNLVLDEAVEEKENGEKVRMGMVVRTQISLASPKMRANPNRSFEETQSLCSKHSRGLGATIGIGRDAISTLAVRTMEDKMNYLQAIIHGSGESRAFWERKELSRLVLSDYNS